MSDYISPRDLDDPYRTDERGVVGYCEHCGAPIYKHEDHWEFPSGTYVHDDCFDDYIRFYYQDSLIRGE